MPRYDYKCDRGHVTERVVRLADAPGPKWIRCHVHMSTTHYENCRANHDCGLQAKRVEVYQVGVGGDLPTRGAF
jgi:hypothetical protein